jgi:ABC-type uncharacterized transport system involved in gliding motility auxiliary subunit
MKKVLVAYASRYGSTAEVAQAIGARLGERDMAVDVKNVEEVKDLAGYSAVVVGSAVRVGRWLPAATKFVQQHKSALSGVPLAYLLEGTFTSYFAGKPIPVREVQPEKKEGETAEMPGAPETPKPPAATPPAAAAQPGPQIERQGQFIGEGKPGKVFVMPSSEMLRNVVIDETGRGPNSVFAMNVIDYLNGREGIAVMRSKEQKINPLEDTSPDVKTAIKAFNIAGLPVLTAVFGLFVWMRRSARKKAIQRKFQKSA